MPAEYLSNELQCLGTEAEKPYADSFCFNHANTSSRA